MAVLGQAGFRRGREVTGRHDAGGMTTRPDPPGQVVRIWDPGYPVIQLRAFEVLGLMTMLVIRASSS